MCVLHMRLVKNQLVQMAERCSGPFKVHYLYFIFGGGGEVNANLSEWLLWKPSTSTFDPLLWLGLNRSLSSFHTTQT